jgi:hypothetical protein
MAAGLYNIKGESESADLCFDDDGEIAVKVHNSDGFAYFTADRIRGLYDAMKEYFGGGGKRKIFELAKRECLEVWFARAALGVGDDGPGGDMLIKSLYESGLLSKAHYRCGCPFCEYYGMECAVCPYPDVNNPAHSRGNYGTRCTSKGEPLPKWSDAKTAEDISAAAWEMVGRIKQAKMR